MSEVEYIAVLDLLGLPWDKSLWINNLCQNTKRPGELYLIMRMISFCIYFSIEE